MIIGQTCENKVNVKPVRKGDAKAFVDLTKGNCHLSLKCYENMSFVFKVQTIASTLRVKMTRVIRYRTIQMTFSRKTVPSNE